MKEYKAMFDRVLDFKGRSNLREFWICVLFNIIFSFATYIFALPFVGDKRVFWIVAESVSSLYALIVFLPMLSLTIRRLHDVKKSGWWILIALLPPFGEIILLMFLCKSSFSVNAWYGDYKSNDKTVEDLKRENDLDDTINKENLQTDKANVSEKKVEDTANDSQVKPDSATDNKTIKVDAKDIQISDKPRTRAEKITELQQLKDNGLITKEEYEKSLFNILTK